MASYAEDFCRCLELRQPYLQEGGGVDTCLRFQDSVETSSQAGLEEVLPGPNSVLSSVHFLNSSGGAPGVMDRLGVVEVTTPGFRCVGMVPH